MSEASGVSRLYPQTELLAGEAAGPAALTAALSGASVLHYAGHAVFDDTRPEQSFLLLARPPGANASGRLSAGDVEQLDLRHVRLVVLSACQTLRSRDGSSAGFAGLAGSLLAAGAGGVVGSLWRVDDELTRQLMIEFHRVYRDSTDGPQALRAAQVSLLRSPNPALRSPAAWAGFRYAGS